MTKGELRKARRLAVAAGRPLVGELALRGGDQDAGPVSWSDSPAGLRARERWARRYDDLNGAPEGEWDR